MRRTKHILLAGALVALVALIPGTASAKVGASVYRVDRNGQPTSGGGSTACCCITGNFGTVGYGVEVCYLP